MATLSGSSSTSAASVNLSTVGLVDWIHWSDLTGTGGNPIRKSGGGSLISDYSMVAGASPGSYAGGPVSISWTGGTPTASGSDSNINYTQNGTVTPGMGFSVTLPADTSTRVATFYFSCGNAIGDFRATLSDGSAADYTTSLGSGSGNVGAADFTITWAAGAPGQTLTVTWLFNSDYGGGGWVAISGIGLTSVTSSNPAVNDGAHAPEAFYTTGPGRFLRRFGLRAPVAQAILPNQTILALTGATKIGLFPGAQPLIVRPPQNGGVVPEAFYVTGPGRFRRPFGLIRPPVQQDVPPSNAVALSGSTQIGFSPSASASIAVALGGATSIGAAPAAAPALALAISGATNVGAFPGASTTVAVGLTGSTGLGLAPSSAPSLGVSLAGATALGLLPAAQPGLALALTGATMAGAFPVGGLGFGAVVSLTGSTVLGMWPAASPGVALALSGATGAGMAPSAQARLALALAGATSAGAYPAAAMTFGAIVQLSGSTMLGLFPAAAGKLAVGLTGSTALGVLPAALAGISIGLTGATYAGIYPAGALILGTVVSLTGSSRIGVWTGGAPSLAVSLQGAAQLGALPAAQVKLALSLSGATGLGAYAAAIPALAVGLSGATRFGVLPTGGGFSALNITLLQLTGSTRIGFWPTAHLGYFRFVLPGQSSRSGRGPSASATQATTAAKTTTSGSTSVTTRKK